MLKVLGIESSCDDTSASVVTSDRKILSNIIVSQHEQHRPYLGVVPEIAARAHLDNMDYCVKSALERANLTLDEIDAISVTVGPGLIGGLIVGMMYGQGLSHIVKKKLLHINHLEGHILTARLANKDLDYPYLALLISGGHSEFIYVKGTGDYQVIGRTLDDSVGECIDKVAKRLDLGYPGGPVVEKMALSGDHTKYPLPIPMLKSDNCDLSFSGLKTAARLLIQDLLTQMRLEEFVNDVCASLQYSIVRSLVLKTKKAIQELNLRTNLALAGGVACNLYFQSELQKAISPVKLITSPKELCTDNAAMIAWAGIERIQVGLDDQKHSLNAQMRL
ncbi:DNA-binding/iron metalloprotein/AP endonuclease [Candidatus Phycorickettsia trachydisci]|uniref:tRNA N6-adenosine threonylcarbamoyltransferase n=1 Tax=Candidatus Phycorickettsia trachydisci TaxID=2115978 RepID=A0A2P1PA02_9RICK|nr:tRNA (adenosine(37)-N6)-threonylcarbamoyltransferase complex transferase subunit TsaD [Candidatus Phycorickettsia trachydisci]AVP88097.1 DNA-binding/iron metalloprotein/AP endonuclease [Candidatus Phycorickettsia trachydisci]